LCYQFYVKSFALVMWYYMLLLKLLKKSIFKENNKIRYGTTDSWTGTEKHTHPWLLGPLPALVFSSYGL